MNYSYNRISMLLQDEQRQDAALNELFAKVYHVEKQYIDRITAKNTGRPQLQALLSEVKAGDHIYVESISKFAYDIDDLRSLTEQIKNKGAVVHFVKEGFDTSGHMYRFMLTILGAIEEMERETSAVKIRLGLEKAKRYGTKSGKPIGRAKPKLPPTFREIYEKMQTGKYTKVDMAKYLGVSRATAYRWIRYYESRIK